MEKKEKTYGELVAEVAASLGQLQQNMAWAQVRDIAAYCSAFKIGKTGGNLETRFNQDDYRGKYDHIKGVMSSKDWRFIGETEVYLIEKAKMFPNCQNIKEASSLHDKMAENADLYQVYIVWND